MSFTNSSIKAVSNGGLAWASRGGAGPKTEPSDLRQIATAISKLGGFKDYEGEAKVGFIQTSTGHWLVTCSGAALGEALVKEIKGCVNGVVPEAQQAGWTVLDGVKTAQAFTDLVSKTKSEYLKGSSGFNLGCSEKKLLSYLLANSLKSEKGTLSVFDASGEKSKWVYPCESCCYCIAYYYNTLCASK